MDTENPPRAGSIAAAEMYYGWLDREALREENARLREELSKLDPNP